MRHRVQHHQSLATWTALCGVGAVVSEVLARLVA